MSVGEILDQMREDAARAQRLSNVVDFEPPRRRGGFDADFDEGEDPTAASMGL